MFSFFGSRYRTRTQRIELKFSLKLPYQLLHQVSSGQLDPIRIRATPNRSSMILPIQTNPLTIFTFFSARWTPNAMLTTYKQFWTLTISCSTESGPNRSPEPSADDFQNFFVQMDTECDVDHVQTVLNIVRFPDPPNRPSNQHRIDDHSDLLAGGLI